MIELRHHDVEIAGPRDTRVRLHVVEAGPKAGRLMLLLHGFPEFWKSWEKQIEPLAAAGFRVLVPDQRGYNLSEKPPGVASYDIDLLASDVVGLIRWAGHERAILVGHDWGAAVAWHVALRYPEAVERLVIANGPHPRALIRHFRKPAQLRRSWYIFGFQIPYLPELSLASRDYRWLAGGMKATSRKGTFTREQLDEYKQAWAQPGALSSMLNWYRAVFRSPRRGMRTWQGTVKVPTTIIWGENDAFLGRSIADESARLCESVRLERIAGASHWVQHEEPDQVTRLILESAH
ncbi:MAG TPA: alpha/beta hydrolase [Bdellovibrionota bacterium]|nr:alpha/beta hydrolase [Bdellovibrionota bacterium]